MSETINTELLERAAEVLDLAHDHAEYWTNTTTGKIIDMEMAQVIKDIEGDLENLYHHSLPNLEKRLITSAGLMAQEHFNNYDLLPKSDVMEWGDTF